jgi:hypothetical protein
MQRRMPTVIASWQNLAGREASAPIANANSPSGRDAHSRAIDLVYPRRDRLVGTEITCIQGSRRALPTREREYQREDEEDHE